MNKSVKLALTLMPYTCPILDQLGKDYLNDLDLNNRQRKIFLNFIEDIKKDITCPMRTALEEACGRIV